jgi:hypothetical protein
MSIHPKALLKQKIKKNLSRIPENKLKEIDDFIDFILHKSDLQEEKPVQLKGIWENSGFEKIGNLDQELTEIRKELSNSILKRNVL